MPTLYSIWESHMLIWHLYWPCTDLDCVVFSPPCFTLCRWNDNPSKKGWLLLYLMRIPSYLKPLKKQSFLANNVHESRRFSYDTWAIGWGFFVWFLSYFTICTWNDSLLKVGFCSSQWEFHQSKTLIRTKLKLIIFCLLMLYMAYKLKIHQQVYTKWGVLNP